MSERDKFLTEAMGGTDVYINGRGDIYAKTIDDDMVRVSWPSFSTWQGFGKLWEWAIEQKWLEDFLNIADVGNFIKCSSGDTFDIQKEFINPDRFANAIYEYLKATP